MEREALCVVRSAAASRDIAVSVDAPYFAILTVEEEDRAKQCLAALEHTMKLGKALGSRTICAHPGNKHGRSGPELLDLVRARLEYLAPKVQHLGVALGLETGKRAPTAPSATSPCSLTNSRLSDPWSTGPMCTPSAVGR